MGPIGRAVRNAGWLLGGKGVGGLFSLVYLALAARGLGTEGFGVFALVLSYGQAAANIVQFQSWQTVIRYGAEHLAAGRTDALRRVLAFTALLDLGAATAGAVLAAAATPLAAPLFGWTPAQQQIAALFGASLLFGLRGTPTGVLRLFDRFDLAAYSETVLPTMRLLGAVAAWFTGPTTAKFLLAWAVAELVTTVVMWLATLRELRRAGVVGGARVSPRGVVGENPGLWRFALTTNVTSSINLVWQQLPTLVVGGVAGAATAGGYRIAAQITSALSKPAASLTRSIYPEFAKLAVGGGAAALAPVLRRATRYAALVGLSVVLVVAVAGRPALELIGGEGYAFAYPFLVALSFAAAIDLCGFGFEPAFVALGRPGVILGVRASVGCVYAGLIFLLTTTYGAIGAAMAAVTAAVLSIGLLVFRWRGAARSAA